MQGVPVCGCFKGLVRTRALHAPVFLLLIVRVTVAVSCNATQKKEERAAVYRTLARQRRREGKEVKNLEMRVYVEDEWLRLFGSKTCGWAFRKA